MTARIKRNCVFELSLDIEMGSSYTRYNFIKVTTFLDHWFLKDPMVKKAPSNDQYNPENSNMTNITPKHHNDQNNLKNSTMTKITLKTPKWPK